MQESLPPDRATLVAEIARLRRQLEAVDVTQNGSASTTASPIASTSRNTSPDSLSAEPLKKKKEARFDVLTGPLPPALAHASRRHIALLFTYEGWAYSGLAYQPEGSPTNLPTVENILLNALVKSRLINPIINEDGFGCKFERCGRTDAGVSSSGQVVNLWVRSELADPMNTGIDGSNERSLSDEQNEGDASQVKRGKKISSVELPYVSLLNRVLPESIRVLAWSPVSTNFSSRYSCIWRHYKYFFSSSVTAAIAQNTFDFGSAYAQVNGSSTGQAEWQKNLETIDWRGMNLDVDRMREALWRIIGEHDFRNFCRIDAAKQLPTHRRSIISATIDPVPGEGPDMFVLNLRGGAFLYNQVRTIIALLFLVGARLEPPSIMERLLWTSDRTPMTEEMHPVPEGTTREVIDRKPGFEIGDDIPLILWKCGFSTSEFDWRIDCGPPLAPPRPQDSKRASINPVEVFRSQYLQMNEIYTQQRLKAIILKHHLASYSFQAPPQPTTSPSRVNTLIYTPLGMGRSGKSSRYVPLLERQRGDPPEIQNARWARGRGQKRMKKREENLIVSEKAREINLEKKRLAFELQQREQEEQMRSAENQ